MRVKPLTKFELEIHMHRDVYEHSNIIADACIIDKADMLNDFVSATVKCEVNSHVYV